MNSEAKKWYQTNGAIIASLIVFFPLGLFLMWKYARAWNKPSKWVLTVIFGFILLMIVTSASHSNDQSKQATSMVTSAPTKEPTATPKPTTSPTITQKKPTPKPTSKPVAKVNIVVTSEIVKKVADNTYRYFFNVANNSDSDFKGSLFIQINNGHNDPQPLMFGGATQDFTDSPIQAGLNQVVQFDDSHAPYQVAGIDGATTFYYSVTINDKEVASGNDSITNQYEDTLKEMQQ